MEAREFDEFLSDRLDYLEADIERVANAIEIIRPILLTKNQYRMLRWCFLRWKEQQYRCLLKVIKHQAECMAGNGNADEDVVDYPF